MTELDEEYNPIQEMQSKSLEDKIKEWYVDRGTRASKVLEQRGIDTREEKDFADSVQRQTKLEEIEQKDMSKLEQIQASIEKFASAVGVQFDTKTGKVYFGAKRDPNVPVPQKEEVDSTKDELSRVSREHSEVTQNLYGEDLNNPGFDAEKSKNPGIVAAVNQKKLDLMKRDASVKKLLEAKVRLEVAKDKMDMHGARHVAEKYRMMMILEQLRLELVREMALGAKEDDLTIQNLQHQISGLTNQISTMENQFETSRAAYASEFGAARNELENATKSVEYESKSASSNKYSRNLTYSEDGILNGSEVRGKKDDRQVGEREIFDERGVMIFDVADVLSREKTINIDGVTVSCVTEFGTGTNVEDSFYIGDMEQLEVNTNGARAVVEEKPDIDEEKDNTDVGNLTTISLFQRDMVRYIGYKIAPINVGEYADINSFTPEQVKILGAALGALGGNQEMLLRTVVDLINEGIEREEDKEIEDNPYEERKYTNED